MKTTPNNSIERDRSLSSNSLQSTNSLTSLMDNCESEGGERLRTDVMLGHNIYQFIILRSRQGKNTGDSQGSLRSCVALDVFYLAISQGWLYRSAFYYWHVRSLRTVLVFAWVARSLTLAKVPNVWLTKRKGKCPCEFNVGKQGLSTPARYYNNSLVVNWTAHFITLLSLTVFLN